MKFEESLLNEIRDRNDIVDVIGSYITLKKKGSSYFGLCPFHNEKTPSFSVDPRKQIFKCFGGCGAAGNVFSFVMQYENFTFPEAVKFLAERVGIEVPEIEMTKEQKQQASVREKIYEIHQLAGIFYYKALYSKEGALALKYLKERGLTDETIKSFGLGYSDKKRDSLYKFMKEKGYKDDLLRQTGLFTFDEKQGANDKFWNRVMFPIFDYSGKVVAFGGRVMGDAKPKYLNSPETPIFHKSEHIYGINRARKTRKPYVILCEGYMDVISLHQAGFDNAVAALGTAFTGTHAQRLKRLRIKDVVCSFDSDDAGRDAAVRTIPHLKEAGFRIKVLDMNPYKDPDEIIKAKGPKEYDQRVVHATNYFIFLVQEIAKKYNMDEPQEKTDFYNEIATMLLEFKDALERENYIDAVCKEFNIDKVGLTTLVKKNALGYVPKKQESHQAFVDEKKRRVLASQTAQNYVISILCEHPEAYAEVKKYLEPSDFMDDIHIKAVELLYKQLDSGEANPSAIVDCFVEDEDREVISNLFMPPNKNELDNSNESQMLTDAVKRIKNESIEHRLANATDPQVMMQAMQEKKKLGTINITF